MAKKDDFELEYDFEKELGFDLNKILGEDEPLEDMEEPEVSAEEEFEEEYQETSADTVPEEAGSDEDEELEELLDPNFLASLGISMEEETVEEDAIPEPQVPQEPEEEYAEPNFLSEDYEEVTFGESAEEEPFFDAPAVDETDDEPVNVYIPASEPAFEVEPELGEEFMAAFEENFPSAESEVPQTQEQEPAPAAPIQSDTPQNAATPPRRRRKLSKERIIKEVYLPPIIAALALILIISFIGTAIGRAVKENKDREEALQASNQASSGALQTEADLLMAEAKELADSYDYDAAIAKLDSYSGEMSQNQAMMDMYNSYTQARDKLVPFQDYASIPNLSFHGLIADPARAFIDETYGKSYNQNYVTTDEFAKILQQLYDNNFVLVDFDSFIVETKAEDGTVTYSTTPLYLPEGKKPLMLTQTLVNYEIFTIDSDGDMEADKGGDGFASRLVVDSRGEIVNEYVDAEGNTLTGAYDLVPILNNFLKEHPDFSYKGAKAILAVTGEDGVFGYRIMHSVKEKKGEDYYNQQVEGAKKIAQALRDDGYTIGCYTYSNVPYGELSATKIQGDLDAWSREVVPVLGKVDLLVYAKASDISADGNYETGSQNKYNVLKNEGFRYFISSANVPYIEVTVNYVRQSRIMVTGGLMSSAPSTYQNYFDPASVLNEQRGK